MSAEVWLCGRRKASVGERTLGWRAKWVLGLEGQPGLQQREKRSCEVGAVGARQDGVGARGLGTEEGPLGALH